MEGQTVAYLDIYPAGHDSYDMNSSIEVCGNDQFILGRDPELCRHSWSADVTISRRHVRVHCVLYEENPVSDIAPFVYATDLSANGTLLCKVNSNPENPVPMMRNRAVLLDYGDELHLSATVRLRFRPARFFEPIQLTPIQEGEKLAFKDRYSITGRLLGEGACGKVLVGINQQTQQQLACKVIRLDHLYKQTHLPNMRLPTGEKEVKCSSGRKRWPPRVAACFREFDILKDLAHPNIIAIEKVFWSNNTIYLFQELVTGGDLFSFLEYNGGRLDNAQAAVVIRQVLIGIRYLHEQGIVHRDLKPDNILMTSLDDGARLVISDFGVARNLPNHTPSDQGTTAKYQRMFSYVGTLEYTAPEIHKANPTIPKDLGYTSSVDMWSIGSITATVLTGDVIFTNRAHPEYENNPGLVIMDLAGQCDLSVLDALDHPIWTEVTSSAKNFIKGLLVLDEKTRMTATEALEHIWFANQYYAEDLENVYKRAVADWQPRQPGTQLVERISKPAPDLTAIQLPEKRDNYASTSRFFPDTKQQSANSIMETAPDSQCRPNTPLLPSTDDDTHLQFASPPAQSIKALHRSSNNHAEIRAPCGHDSQLEGSCCSSGSKCHSGTQDHSTAEGMYHAQDTIDYESYDTTTSLNEVAHMDYPQYLHNAQSLSLDAQSIPRNVTLQEFPQENQDVETDYGSCESYQQTRYPDEHIRRNATVDDEEACVVRETPPRNISNDDDYAKFTS